MNILILGANSPIARQLAFRYAERGYGVCLATRQIEEATQLAEDLKIRFAVQTLPLSFDARAFSTHPGLIAKVEEELGPLDVALLAFGEMGDQLRSQEEFSEALQVIEVNYTGAVSLCESIAARMQARGRGSILGISSVAGERGRQSNYFYGSAKGAFTRYLQGLRNRLHPEGVHVLTAKLGFVDTKMTFGMESKIPIASPEQVSRALFKAQQRRQDLLFYPPFWEGIMSVIRHIPEGLFKRLSL